MRKISPPPGFDPRTDQPVASSYTEYVILEHKHEMKRKFFVISCAFKTTFPDNLCHKLTFFVSGFRAVGAIQFFDQLQGPHVRLYFFYHFHARVRTTDSFQQKVLNISRVSIAVFPSFKHNFMFFHSPMTTKNTTSCSFTAP